jgi:hypothetical protein
VLSIGLKFSAVTGNGDSRRTAENCAGGYNQTNKQIVNTEKTNIIEMTCTLSLLRLLKTITIESQALVSVPYTGVKTSAVNRITGNVQPFAGREKGGGGI